MSTTEAAAVAAMIPAQTLVGGQFIMTRRIGKGSFGEIYEGRSQIDQQPVAIKIESGKRRNPHLMHESKLYRMLQGIPGVPRIFWYGNELNSSILVMQLLGPSTEDLFEQHGRKFSRKTSLMVFYQFVCRMEGIHNAGVIHRDIKPHNFVVSPDTRWPSNGFPNGDTGGACIYVIDFGLSKRYTDTRHQHQPYREGRNLTGTARYVSINTHYGVEPSRRDDMESCFYVLLYFLRGSLPWQGLRAANKKEKYLRIMEHKVSSSAAFLCKDMPPQLTEMLSKIRNMRYVEDPDYKYLKRTIRWLLERYNTPLDFHYDWLHPAPQDPLENALWDTTADTGGGGRHHNMRLTSSTAAPPETGDSYFSPLPAALEADAQAQGHPLRVGYTSTATNCQFSPAAGSGATVANNDGESLAPKEFHTKQQRRNAAAELSRPPPATAATASAAANLNNTTTTTISTNNHLHNAPQQSSPRHSLSYGHISSLPPQSTPHPLAVNIAAAAPSDGVIVVAPAAPPPSPKASASMLPAPSPTLNCTPPRSYRSLTRLTSSISGKGSYFFIRRRQKTAENHQQQQQRSSDAAAPLRGLSPATPRDSNCAAAAAVKSPSNWTAASAVANYLGIRKKRNDGGPTDSLEQEILPPPSVAGRQQQQVV